jgi:hypothetical protein
MAKAARWSRFETKIAASAVMIGTPGGLRIAHRKTGADAAPFQRPT